jgi:hypothetical protein
MFFLFFLFFLFPRVIWYRKYKGRTSSLGIIAGYYTISLRPSYRLACPKAARGENPLWSLDGIWNEIVLTLSTCVQ